MNSALINSVKKFHPPAADFKPLNHDILLVTLDSLRFDVAAQAHTPNLDALGHLRRAWSYGSFTLPSHAALFGGFLPNVVEEPLLDFYSRERGQLWRLSRARQQAAPRARVLLEGDNIVEGFRGKGYSTLGFGGVRWFSGGYFPGLFDTFDYWGPTDDTVDKFAPRRTGDFALDRTDHIVARIRGADRAFVFVNAAETHAPYTLGTGDRADERISAAIDEARGFWNGAAAVPDSAHAIMTTLKLGQQRALEAVDQKLGDLFSALPRPTLAVVCADHGEAFGEQRWWGHNLAAAEVMAVPLWIGVVDQ